MRLWVVMHILRVCCVSLASFTACQATNCTTGWFGLACKYKCRCTSNKCDKDGLCTGASRCQGGWFGPGCQYVDLAYRRSVSKLATDGNDDTCLQYNDRVTVMLPDAHVLSWFRFLVNDHEYRQKLELTMKYDATDVLCHNIRNVTVEDMLIDIYCDVNSTANTVIVTGEGVNYLCSFYISGGRNVALKENAWQSSTHVENSEQTKWQNVSFTEDKAVDGTTDQIMVRGNSCSRTLNLMDGISSWGLTFPRPIRMHSYVIYGRIPNAYEKTCLFAFSAVGSEGTSRYRMQINISDTGMRTDAMLPVPIVRINISCIGNLNLLILCEVEIYGESICDTGTYGRDCEQTCNCLQSDSCLAATGGCHSGCSQGFRGEDCKKPCPPDTFGSGCHESCIRYCVKDNASLTSCDAENGSCFHGCNDGYTGLTCRTECGQGTYGKDCRLRCSSQCYSKYVHLSPCHPKDGTCIYGCLTGLSGRLCDIRYATAEESVAGNVFVLCILSTLAFAAVSLIHCLRNKRKLTPAE